MQVLVTPESLEAVCIHTLAHRSKESKKVRTDSGSLPAFSQLVLGSVKKEKNISNPLMWNVVLKTPELVLERIPAPKAPVPSTISMAALLALLLSFTVFPSTALHRHFATSGCGILAFW